MHRWASSLLQVVLPDGSCVKWSSHAAAAVKSGSIVHIVSFGGVKGTITVAATAVMKISESLLL